MIGEVGYTNLPPVSASSNMEHLSARDMSHANR